MSNYFDVALVALMNAPFQCEMLNSELQGWKEQKRSRVNQFFPDISPPFSQVLAVVLV